ncbi:hypothetical protein [Streptomyces sp. NPDC059003]|uniref:hypothetical protein n=1 Tax=Streptomyces sp. NPDC059003 TaxID=3346691 RepID=UPI00369BC7F4
MTGRRHRRLQELQLPLHVLVYDSLSGAVVRYEKRFYWPAADLVPDQGIYPEGTALPFARLLASHGVELPFTTFDQARYERVAELAFHGALYDAATQGLTYAEEVSS